MSFTFKPSHLFSPINLDFDILTTTLNPDSIIPCELIDSDHAMAQAKNPTTSFFNPFLGNDLSGPNPMSGNVGEISSDESIADPKSVSFDSGFGSYSNLNSCSLTDNADDKNQLLGWINFDSSFSTAQDTTSTGPKPFYAFNTYDTSSYINIIPECINPLQLTSDPNSLDSQFSFVETNSSSSLSQSMGHASNTISSALSLASIPDEKNQLLFEQSQMFTTMFEQMNDLTLLQQQAYPPAPPNSPSIGPYSEIFNASELAELLAQSINDPASSSDGQSSVLNFDIMSLLENENHQTQFNLFDSTPFMTILSHDIPLPPSQPGSCYSTPQFKNTKVNASVPTFQLNATTFGDDNPVGSTPNTTSPSNKSSADLSARSLPVLSLSPSVKERRMDDLLLNINFDDVTVSELKDLLRMRGLHPAGRKSVLVDRIKKEIDGVHMKRSRGSRSSSLASSRSSSPAPSVSKNLATPVSHPNNPVISSHIPLLDASQSFQMGSNSMLASQLQYSKCISAQVS